MSLNIQQIRADFPILRGKFSIVLFLSLLFYACNQKSKTEKIVIVANENNKPDLQIKVSKSDLVYSDSILKVYVDKNISFIDSFPIIKRFSNERVYYHNNYFENSPCISENDSLKFIVNSYFSSNMISYSYINYLFVFNNGRFFHSNTQTSCVNLKDDTLRQYPCELFLNKVSYNIKDTIQGVLIGQSYSTLQKEKDTLCFKYIVNKRNKENNFAYFISFDNDIHKIR